MASPKGSLGRLASFVANSISPPHRRQEIRRVILAPSFFKKRPPLLRGGYQSVGNSPAYGRQRDVWLDLSEVEFFVAQALLETLFKELGFSSSKGNPHRSVVSNPLPWVCLEEFGELVFESGNGFLGGDRQLPSLVTVGGRFPAQEFKNSRTAIQPSLLARLVGWVVDAKVFNLGTDS